MAASSTNNASLLASLAVFRELYDSNKDIYVVLSEFLRSTIRIEGKLRFNLTEITGLLNKNYDFHIPEAVVKGSIFLYFLYNQLFAIIGFILGLFGFVALFPSIRGFLSRSLGNRKEKS